MRLAGACFLFFQFAAIIYGRFVPGAYFGWPTYQQSLHYKILSSVRGKVLSKEECTARYRLSCEDTDFYFLEHIVRVVQQYEETYGRTDNAEVLIQYSIDNRKTGEWKWPQP